MQLSPEVRILLNVTGNLYKPFSKVPIEYDLKKVIKLAEMNRLGYFFLINTSKWLKNDIEKTKNEIFKLYENYSEKLKKTIKIINRVIGKKNYVLIKTYKIYPHITYDVDILIKDLHETVSKFLDNGFVLKSKEHSPFKQPILKKGLLPISLHERIAWGRIEVVNSNLLWKNCRKVKIIDNMKVYIPNVEGDLITLIAHVPFELLNIRLGELLYIFNLSMKADWDEIISQTKLNKWYNTFKEFVWIINGLHRIIYNEPSIIEKYVPKYKKVKPIFPFELPFTLIVRAHIEKRSWNKIFSIGFYLKNKLELMRKRIC